jgi:uncharacterized RDD family membrane protein YckC
MKRREPTWKDEVRERMKHHRHRRVEPAPLPLFDPVAPASPGPAEAPAAAPAGEILDLPLRAAESSRATDLSSKEREPALEPPGEEPWPVPPPEGFDAPAPLERPASLSERLEAAAVDLVILGAVSVAVVYFAGRAARAELPALLAAWPYLVAFLAFLGLAYATAFTGLTGQTPGKMMMGLRVVDGAGGRPGPPRAALRVVLAVIGIAVLGLGGLAMLLDPARRALHDRLCRTRVVRI